MFVYQQCPWVCHDIPSKPIASQLNPNNPSSHSIHNNLWDGTMGPDPNRYTINISMIVSLRDVVPANVLNPLLGHGSGIN